LASLTVVSGALPPGLTIGGGEQIIGVPSAAGDYSFSIVAFDSFNCPSAATPYTLHIASSSCTLALPASLPDATAGQPYTTTIVATGANGAVTYVGTNVASDGTLSFTPSSAGIASIDVSAADAAGCQAEMHYDLGVAPVACTTVDVTIRSDECHRQGCVAGTCVFVQLPDNTLVSNDVGGDCAQTVCSSGTPTVVLDTAESCGPDTTCVAIGQCSGQLGAACSGAPAGFCDSGNCVDGVCCDSACNGSCQACSASGTCGAVTGREDPDTCSWPHECSAGGTCGLYPGQPCGTPSDCARGTCVTAYADGDNDGYAINGAPSAGTRCIDDSTQYGNNYYADRQGDCCDSDQHVNPAAGSSNVPSSCGGPWQWDLNCNGVIESDYQVCNTSSCSGSGWCFATSVPPCTQTADGYYQYSDCSLSTIYPNGVWSDCK
jgi:hypothetical protein